MKRLFTFGCSYTKYYYPTWADILILDSKEGYNCGTIGSGNQLISNRIFDLHARKNFTKDDTVIIMWSNFFREDVYDTKWNTRGNIFFWKDNVNLDNLPYYVYRDCNIITSTLLALKQTGATVISTSINNPYTDKELLNIEKINTILQTYKKYVTPQTKTIAEKCWYPNIEKDKTRPKYLIDGKWITEDHPLPLEHLDFVQEELGFEISEYTKDIIQKCQLKLHSREVLTYDKLFETGKQPDWIL